MKSETESDTNIDSRKKVRQIKSEIESETNGTNLVGCQGCLQMSWAGARALELQMWTPHHYYSQWGKYAK